MFVQDERRVKCSVLSLTPLDFAKECDTMVGLQARVCRELVLMVALADCRARQDCALSQPVTESALKLSLACCVAQSALLGRPRLPTNRIAAFFACCRCAIERA